MKTNQRIRTLVCIVVLSNTLHSKAQFAHLTFQSQSGDSIGLGKTEDIIYTPSFGGFFSASTPWILPSGEPASVVFLMGLGKSQKPFASLIFSTGQLGIPLQPGYYPAAQRAPFESPDHPGLDFGFDGRGCNTLTGNFTILEISYSPTLVVESFSASFEQHCEGNVPALFGTFTYQAVPPSPPELICPEPLTLECTNGTAIGTLQVGVMDTNGFPLEVIWTVDGTVCQTNNMPSGGTVTASNVTFTANFGEGEHAVVVSASNGLAAPVSCSTTVTVSDTLPPTVLAISATPDFLWPPNHRMVPVNVVVGAVDNCDPSPVAHITQVISNQPQKPFAPDWEITGPLSVNLRAERLGSKGERKYTIVIECEDASGNVSSASVDVFVPHDHR